MEGSNTDETGTAATKELKNADSVEVLHERRPETNSTENEESVENSLSESTTKAVEKEEEEEWLDILGSGQLKKKVIKKGTPDSRPQRSDVCTVSYEGKLEDGTVVEQFDRIQINVGDVEVIQGIDFILPLMDVGEECEAIISPRFAYGDHGLLPEVPPKATLYYKITLHDTECEPEAMTLPIQKRREIGNRKKERGNWWYSRQEHTLAIQCYRRALDYLDDIESPGVMEDNKSHEEEIHDLLDDRIKVYNNLAAAQMKISAYDTALSSVDKVLRCQPKNVKALFRKGKIYSAKGETEIAIPILKEALALEPGSLPIKTELNKLLSRQRHDTAEQRNLYKKMLGTDKEENKSSSSHNSSVNSNLVKIGLLVGGVAVVAGAFIYKYKVF